MKKVYDTINQYCVEHDLLMNGDGIVIGLSGGVDSVCLLQVLAALRNEWQLRLVCVHVHHGIRGTAADEDAAFAQRLAAKYNISFRLYEMDIPQLAKEQGLSESEIDKLVVLDVKDKDYFEGTPVTYQHGGGYLFCRDKEIMGWLFNQ